jgi:RNA polymerase sigma factor (sigma-70 family)
MRSFLAAHAALLLRLARGATRPGDRIEPEDVANEAVAALLGAAERGTLVASDIANAEAYLRIVVRHAAMRARTRRSAGERPSAEDDDLDGVVERFGGEADPNPEEATARALDARKTLDAIKAKLRPRDAVAFALMVEDGQSIDEVAASLGTTANNVYQMRFRILEVVREITGVDMSNTARKSGGV